MAKPVRSESRLAGLIPKGLSTTRSKTTTRVGTSRTGRVADATGFVPAESAAPAIRGPVTA